MGRYVMVFPGAAVRWPTLFSTKALSSPGSSGTFRSTMQWVVVTLRSAKPPPNRLLAGYRAAVGGGGAVSAGEKSEVADGAGRRRRDVRHD